MSNNWVTLGRHEDVRARDRERERDVIASVFTVTLSQTKINDMSYEPPNIHKGFNFLFDVPVILHRIFYTSYILLKRLHMICFLAISACCRKCYHQCHSERAHTLTKKEAHQSERFFLPLYGQISYTHYQFHIAFT